MITFWLYFALFVTILLFVWSFYLIAKIHTYKFREYSTHIRPVTRLVGLILLVMTVLGLYVVFRELWSKPTSTSTIEKAARTEIY